ncbi:MAG: adenylate/guanylate cyclase domain-containing protein [Pseudomonadota bacterium]
MSRPAHDPDRPQQAAVEQRLDRLLAAEGVKRMRMAAMATTAAFVVIGPLLTLLTGWPDAIYYWALLLGFIAFVWMQYGAVMRWPDATWPDYAFPAANFAMLGVVLAVPNPLSDFADYQYAPSMMMRFGNVLYFFLILSTLALSFSPGVVLWGGLCAAVAWSVARLWTISQPGIELLDESAPDFARLTIEEAFLEATHPRYVDMGIWIQEVVMICIIAAVLSQVVRGSRRLLLRNALEERRGANLARYLPAQMAERMADTDEPFLEDREAEAVVLFTDIVGFTRWAEAHGPKQTVALLREVHGLVAQEVFRADGVLDKFIGDGAMATFGLARADAPEARALACVDGILRRMAALNRARATRGEAPVRLSLGLHRGPVTVGDVGAAERLEMAVLGDAVNLASRLESMTRPLGCAAIASEAVMTGAGGAPAGWRRHGEAVVRGRENPVTIWTRAADPDDPAAAVGPPAASATSTSTAA